MTKRILIQLDSDPQPSSFDSVVAIDSGVDHLLRYGQVQVSGVARPEEMRKLQDETLT